ncbi:MAG: hypothetical protein UX39_C0002G0024 [Candidatus Magasanikbacteria bacterium GW2011_GWA2_46_17]|uniref:Baseplate protein J-like domain-containing protein n=1 Tax=Candidatus Magasanikbacteria bacterium GW2011_GWA2_46_17 TaxID=1619042 RepID=A0A0G1S220_9BACT|nr:MAG: hypothetical protein UX39_C0002G0024 [Candidatus Magasanikbacteria bacterium GW2011_GWA2_46_17]HBF67170.1 hypothetical protein [Candidatus Magasanikbacteria bacterium]
MPPKKKIESAEASTPQTDVVTAAPIRKPTVKKRVVKKTLPTKKTIPAAVVMDVQDPIVEAHRMDDEKESDTTNNTHVRFYRNIAFGFLGLTLLLFGAVYLMSLKRVTITLATRPATIEAQAVVLVAEQRNDLNSIRGSVQVWQDTYTKEFYPQSVREEPGIAAGKATLYNDTDRAQPLVATTRLLSKDGLLFRLKTAITIPARGTIQADVYADQTGEKNNINPTQFTIPGLTPAKQEVIYAKNESPMTGGVKRIGILGEADVKRAQEEFTTVFRDFVTEKAKMLLPDFSGVVVEMQDQEITVEGEVGKEVDVFTVNGKARIIAIGYETRELTEWANTKLKEKIGQNRLTLTIPDAAPELHFDALTEGNKEARLIVTRSGSLHLDKDNVLIQQSAFVGKTAKDIKDYLGQVPGIDAVTIEFFPRWLKNAPSNPDKITVTLVDKITSS